MGESAKRRFACVLDKSLEIGMAFNAVGHLAAGLVAMASRSDEMGLMDFKDYVDNEGSIYPSISDHPFIVLKGKQSHIRQLRQNLQEQHAPFVMFLDTMTIGTWQEQHQKTKETKTDNLVVYGITVFGDEDRVRELTKKFSLWR